MPITKAAKKALRQSKVNQKRNYNTRSKVKKAVKELEEALKAGKVEDAVKMLPRTQKEIDMAVKKNILHKSTAARKKSQLAKGVSKAQGK